MSTGPNTNSADCNREKLVSLLRDEALVKQLEAANHLNEIGQKAVDVILKRMAGHEVSAHMLLRIVVSLSKSTAFVKFDLGPRRRRSSSSASR
jgi:hypothetical protein